MTKPLNTKSIETATNRSWDDWMDFLDTNGARNLEHPRIAELIHNDLNDKVDSPGWWAQQITVAYEQSIGRRRPGQQNNGSFEMSVTKRITGMKKVVFALWQATYDHVTVLNGVKISNIRTSETPVRYYWRCDLADGSKFAVSVEEKKPGKAMIAATHTNLSSEELKDTWRVYWKEALEKL